MTSAAETFAVSVQQAEGYEARFVPALFAQWAEPLLDLAGVTSGQRVLDVACGTGALARAAAMRVGSGGQVVGVDLNEAMLTVARRLRPDLEWRQGDAGSLPMPDGVFDAVLCQSALMFFPDATRALREMRRAARPGGAVGVQVYASLGDQPAYGPWCELVVRHAGPEAASLLGTYWVHGDLEGLRARFRDAGLDVAQVRTVLGTAAWASVDEMVTVEVENTPLVDRLTAGQYRQIREESRALLAAYEQGGHADVPIQSHLVLARVAAG